MSTKVDFPEPLTGAVMVNSGTFSTAGRTIPVRIKARMTAWSTLLTNEKFTSKPFRYSSASTACSFVGVSGTVTFMLEAK